MTTTALLVRLLIAAAVFLLFVALDFLIAFFAACFFNSLVIPICLAFNPYGSLALRVFPVLYVLPLGTKPPLLVSTAAHPNDVGPPGLSLLSCVDWWVHAISCF